MDYKLGKLSARRDPRTLRLSAYTECLPPAPAICNLTGAMSNIGTMLNEFYGDCTAATVGHMIQQWTAETGSQFIPKDESVLAFYSAVSGFDPKNRSTDRGAVAIDVLNYWIKTPLEGHQLFAYAYLDSKNIQEIKNSVYYFGNAYVGLALPNSAKNQDVWDVRFYGTHFNGKVGSWGGHSVPIVAYDDKHLICISWGKLKKMTYHFYRTYCDEVYACLSMDWLAKGRSPAGFELEALQKDLQIIRNA